MQSHRNRRRLVASALALAMVAAVLPGLPSLVSGAHAAEKPVAPEKNPPGDIPDTQVFVDYAGSFGIHLKVPEGWARSDRSDGASFVDKYDGVVITLTDTTRAPDPASVNDQYVVKLKANSRAVKITGVKAVKLPAGTAIRITYSSNSEPNPVTNKQIRLENQRYLYFKDGKLATLDLYAPFGADNVDQWQLMSRSFRWK